MGGQRLNWPAQKSGGLLLGCLCDFSPGLLACYMSLSSIFPDKSVGLKKRMLEELADITALVCFWLLMDVHLCNLTSHGCLSASGRTWMNVVTLVECGFLRSFSCV